MQNSLDCEVLIAGAGPTGLTAALALVNQGVQVRIIDDMPVRHATARACVIHARTLELLAPLGVADRIVAYAQPIRAIRFFDATGREMRRREPRPVDSPYPAIQTLQQWHVEWILAEQLLARGVVVEADTRLTAVTQDASSVTAEVESAAGSRLLRCGYLIGADGARSRVRQSIGARMEGFDYPERWIGGELAIDDADVQTENQVLLDPDRVALCFPLDAGVLFFATLRDDEFVDATPGPMAPDQVMRIFDASFGRHAHLARRIVDVPWTGFFRMHSCVVPEYRSGRVFLAGDAAHLCSAAGGYGMNAGIQDAINIAWRLAAHLRLQADPAILTGYGIDRREMFDVINAASDATHRMLTGTRDEPSDQRAASTPVLDEAAADRQAAEVAFGYRADRMWTDLAPSGTLRAGMRMPLNADLSSGEGAARPWVGLYDGVHWTVVLAVASRDHVRTAYLRHLDMVGLVWLNARTRLVLCVGEAFGWNAPRPTLYVVRPDGYVAFRCDSEPGALPAIASLSAWLAATLGPELLVAAAPARSAG